MTTFEAKSVVLLVTGVAFFGLVLGALFGAAAGTIAPSFFQQLMPWSPIEPLGVAVVMGAFGGVLCGGALGVFAVTVQLLSQFFNRNRADRE